ncbi:hypothetical protein JUJ52_14895 [Virgibacillus sp. AGTR]|uniref:Sporulation protein YpjB (SpoYpjB) n=1 Tax=Virgibacillus salarius TaxID=447199 RepID=A0A941IBV3_9BACI|nr:hypothetical protein [Virgibacillus salarius]MCC2251244.1 hypothetical protein [Virgibacillus sp. AGTR]NAZ08283.1 hypothetical protein [Agaribacter marinus]QRZ17033.1 hypothetical protein JUJ52_14695 [Virgibacillus sp. AGTR]
MIKNKLGSVITCILVIIGMIGYFHIQPIMIEASVLVQAKEPPKQNGDLLPLIWTVIIVGGCIGITLTYVSWRKYKGESRKKAKKDKIVD